MQGEVPLVEIKFEIHLLKRLFSSLASGLLAFENIYVNLTIHHLTFDELTPRILL